jgi:uncharacterized protein (TIGR02284 family)
VVTTVGTEDDVVELLRDLIKLDFDAADAYRAAIDRLENPAHREKLRSFLSDHERHTRNLAPFVSELGGTPPSEGSAKSLLTTGKVAIGSLAGDAAIIRAMKSNEDDTNTAYERACARADLKPAMRDVLQGNLADERRHRAWIEQVLNRV